MKYSLNDLDQNAINLIFAGLGELPYKHSAQLMQHIDGQLKLQVEAALATRHEPAKDRKAKARRDAGV